MLSENNFAQTLGGGSGTQQDGYDPQRIIFIFMQLWSDDVDKSNR